MTESLQPQSRRYFGTDGIRGRVGLWPITPEFVLKLGWAIGKVLARHGAGKAPRRTLSELNGDPRCRSGGLQARLWNGGWP